MIQSLTKDIQDQIHGIVALLHKRRLENVKEIEFMQLVDQMVRCLCEIENKDERTKNLVLILEFGKLLSGLGCRLIETINKYQACTLLLQLKDSN